MLQTLSDLFLLISNDGKKITSKDIAVFYNFIAKKMPQIEQQFPSILSKSLISSPNINDKKQNDLNEYKNDKDSKKLFNNFHKQIIYLFNDLIDYCYNEGFIKLNNKIEQLIKGKIDEKIREENDKKIKKNKYDYDYNKYYQNELYLIKSKKEKLRNFLIFLIINGDINFDISPNDYVKFFNSENKKKNRLNAEQFMKFIKNIIKIYKDNKRNINKRLNNKSSNNTDIKINNKEKINNTEEKNNKTDGNKTNRGIKSFNTDSKIFDINIEKIKKTDKHTYTKTAKDNKNNKCSELKSNTKYISISSKNNSMNNKSFKENLIPKNKHSLSPDKSIIIDNDEDFESDDDEINDTIRCETPKNIEEEEEKIEINKKNELDKIILTKDQNLRRYSEDKNKKKPYCRFTVSTIPFKEERNIYLNNNSKRDSTDYYSSKKFKHVKNQKKSLVNRNKKNISQENKNINYHKSFGNDKHIQNIKDKRNVLKNIKPLNKSQNIIDKELLNNNINNNNVYTDKKINNYEDGKNKNVKNKEYTKINDKNYNLVNIRTDKNNNKFKELYLYKDLEIHEHFVICNEDKEEEKDSEDEYSDIKCIIN